MKRKWLVLLCVIGLGLILYLIFRKIILSFGVILLYLVLELYIKSNEKNKKDKLIKEKEYEFSNLLSYLLVFLDNNFNVYQALQLSMGYCKECLVKDVETLINEIDLDKSIIPYQNFAKQFNSNVIYQIVMMIYQLDINGYDSKYLASFPSLIASLKQARIDSIIQARKMNMSFMTIIPLLSLLIIVFSLVIYILSMIGGSI